MFLLHARASLAHLRDGSLLRARPQISVEYLVLLTCSYFVLLCNQVFWRGALAGYPLYSLHGWSFAAALATGLIALHLAVLLLLANRWTVKPLLLVLLVCTGLVSYFMQQYQVHLDASMLRNIARTDVREAGDLLTVHLLWHVLIYAGLPMLLLAWVRIRCPALWPSFWRRLLWMLGALALALAALVFIFQDFSALMRNQKGLRYLITPGNYLVSALQFTLAEQGRRQGGKIALGRDARLGQSWGAGARPTVLVVVVGETVRAANWGLNGYRRQTTPELQALQVVNFPDVTACGTNTEVSLPCMFSVFGRHAYDEAKIQSYEALPQVLQHAGLSVQWRDDQSGCKGVCDGIASQFFAGSHDAQLCPQGECLDEIMLKGLDQQIRAQTSPQVIFLHQMGNHGPAYFHRYPPAFRIYQPSCDTADLGQCDRNQVVNSYDNAIRYTDHFLAQTIRLLAQASDYDTALIYVSDHGESLGEQGIFLHGLPRVIAPPEQTQVPMVMWFSEGFSRRAGLRGTCLRQKAAQPFSHDHLFHTVLGVLDVRTQVYDAQWDISASCRQAPAAAPAGLVHRQRPAAPGHG